MSDSTTESQLLETFVRAAQALDADVSMTIRVETGEEERELSTDPSVELDLHPLRISSSPHSSVHADYLIHDTLGQGGMGVVRSARQNSLNREVALKEIQGSMTSSRASARLIHEAQISGALEHPNIVPIHDLGRNPENQPVMVMKRIEGTSWQELLTNESHSMWNNIKQTCFDWNINVLIDVCRAVEFGHSKDIIHRDIKPENVMIGSFGEVYLLDWGLGYKITAKPNTILPDVAGTPAYMAPEMLEGLSKLGKETDVYLLGACLHHILVGEGPHAAHSVRDALNDVLTTREYFFPPDVPEEIVNVCRAALAYEKKERTPSVTALRESLQEFLMHRTSNSMMREAQTELETLVAVLGINEQEREALTDEDAQLRWTSYTKCRFGFEQALKQWPENTTAQEGLQNTITTMARLEISRGRLQSADYLYAELKTPSKALTQELEALREKLKWEEVRRVELEQVAYDADKRVGALARLKFLYYFFPLAVLMIPAFYFMESLSIEPTSNVELLQYMLISIVVGVPVAYKYWDALYSNERSKLLVRLFLVFTVGLLLSRIIGVIYERPGPDIVRDEFIFMMGIYGVFTANYYSGAWTLVAITFAGLVAMELNPARIFDIFILVHTGITIMMFFIYREDLESIDSGTERSSKPSK